MSQQTLQYLNHFLANLANGQAGLMGNLPPTAMRLTQALSQPAGSPYAPSGLDLACLLAQVVRQRDLLAQQSSVVRLPLAGPWPPVGVWHQAGVGAVTQKDRLRLTVTPWLPQWLGGVEVAADAIQEAPRNPHHTQAIDPFVESLTGYTRYTSSAQKQSLRSLWMAPKGSTLLSIMPTGSGKSLLLQIGALKAALSSGCVVVVVPTVSLALDQEHAMKDLAKRQGVLLPDRLAYYSDQNPGERLALQQRIASGDQPVVFTSPDSLMGSLNQSLIQAAAGGHIAAMVIDEAHYVAQWGSEFRPDFQSMAGLRRHLLRLCPPNQRFVTLLLTATLTSDGLQTLQTLFGHPGPFQMVASVSLRPEIGYYVVDCGLPKEHQLSPAEVQTRENRHRMDYLLQAVLRLPRPMVVYTTIPEDANEIYQRLLKLGLKRVGVVTGESSGAVREEALQAWKEGNLDVMVATSAFGVGVDQAHVRTVIHACVPENLDRFYQEVGRSGRDGMASLSLWLHTSNDWRIAKKQSQQALVTLDVGLQRWGAMLNTAVGVGYARLRIDLNAKPPWVSFEGSTNRLWNQRTLNLMARAGLIELDAENPPRQENFATLDEFDKAMEQYSHSVVVELKDTNHSINDTWAARVEPVRTQQAAADRQGLQALRELASGNKPFEQVLAQTYTLASLDILAWPSLACGGCPDCRDKAIAPYPADPQPVELPEHLEWPAVRTTPTNNLVTCIVYQQNGAWMPHEVHGVLKRLIDKGYRLIVAMESFWPQNSRLRFQRNNVGPFFFEDAQNFNDKELGDVPKVVVLSPGEPWPKWLNSRNFTVPTAVVCDSGREDPMRKTLELGQILGCLTVEQYLRGP